MIVKPTEPGRIAIILETADQAMSYEFIATYLPLFRLIITGDSSDTKDVTKEKIERTQMIYLTSGKSEIKLYEDYHITESVLNINDKTYRSPGNSLSQEVKQAIAGLSARSIIKVEQVTAKSKSTGKELKLRANQTFSIL